jgi:hypothetical protein
VQVRTELGVGGVGELGHGHQLTAKLPAQSYGAQKVLFYPKKVIYPKYGDLKVLFYPNYGVCSCTQIMDPKKCSFTQIMDPKKSYFSK